MRGPEEQLKDYLQNHVLANCDLQMSYVLEHRCQLKPGSITVFCNLNSVAGHLSSRYTQLVEFLHVLQVLIKGIW